MQVIHVTVFQVKRTQSQNIICMQWSLVYIRESVDSLCRDDMDAPIILKSSKPSDSKAFWIAYCVSGVPQRH